MCLRKGTILSPRITIFLPTYEDFETIESALLSAVLQSRRPENIVLLVNAGSERYIKYLKTLTSDYENVHLEIFDVYVSAEKNFNRALDLVEAGAYPTDYFAIFHADDIYDFNYLQVFENHIVQNSEVGLVFSQSIHVNEDLEFLRYQYDRHLNHSYVTLDERKFIDLLCLHGNVFHCPSAFFSASAICDHRFQPSRFGRSSDLFMWWQFVKNLKISILNTHLCFYRFAGKSFSYNNSIKKVRSGDGLKAYKAIIHELESMLWTDVQIMKLKKALCSEKIFEVASILRCRAITERNRIRYKKYLGKILIQSGWSTMHLSLRRMKIFIFGVIYYLRN